MGTNNSVITNADGQFSLNVRNGAVLEVSYVDMAIKRVNGAPNMKITLDADDQILDKVMVVAFGTAKKVSDVTLAGTVPGVALTSEDGSPGFLPLSAFVDSVR